MLTAFNAFEQKMKHEGIHALAIAAFEHHYRQLVAGHSGLLTRDQIEPIENLPAMDHIAGFRQDGMEMLGRTVVVKLNGGLGTSMGLDKAKSLIRVKESYSFLDVIIRQIIDYRERFGLRIPLVLMNSYSTERESLAVTAAYSALDSRLPGSFLQHKVPKVLAEGFAPATCPDQPELEWCPPGHGDLYVALLTSGMLDAMEALGFEYLFVSNADNLGAVIDPGILGYIARHDIPFLMEVARRTPSDTKGGHLARLRDGRLVLREIAQCPEAELAEFQDIELYRYFNTNTLWIKVPALRRLLHENGDLLPLHLIRNAKTLDPRDPSSPRVFQLESAMGAAVSLFDRSSALVVPRSRFSPVKTCDDLLAVWSDAFVLTPAFQVIPNPARTLPAISVDLDKRYYRFIDQLDARFPDGAPSLLSCSSFTVRGDITFGKSITLSGDVTITAGDNPVSIPNGTRLEGSVNL
jgi:UTP--glucose-1-phosphate uridylyltransferase